MVEELSKKRSTYSDEAAEEDTVTPEFMVLMKEFTSAALAKLKGDQPNLLKR